LRAETAAPALRGWEARYIGQDPRLSEIIEQYLELGFEVKTEPFNAADCGECLECFQDLTKPAMVVYVKKISIEEIRTPL